MAIDFEESLHDEPALTDTQKEELERAELERLEREKKEDEAANDQRVTLRKNNAIKYAVAEIAKGIAGADVASALRDRLNYSVPAAQRIVNAAKVVILERGGLEAVYLRGVASYRLDVAYRVALEKGQPYAQIRSIEAFAKLHGLWRTNDEIPPSSGYLEERHATVTLPDDGTGTPPNEEQSKE